MIVSLGRAPYSPLSCRYRLFGLTVRTPSTGVRGAVMGKRWRPDAAGGDEPVALPIRLAVAGVMLWNLAQVGRLAYSAITDMPQPLWWQLGALVVAVPADTVAIVAAIRNVRPRYSGWLLAAVALPVIALVPVSGYEWVVLLTMPAALTLIYFRPPFNVAAFALILVLGVMSTALVSLQPIMSPQVSSQYSSFDVVDLAWAGVALAVLVWLTRTVRELEAARRELAAKAVLIERQRIDDEVAGTLGAALQRIAVTAEQAQALAESDLGRCAGELETLTAQSREALTRTRALLSGYRNVSAEAELRAALTLLSAAGISARLSIDDPDGLPEDLSPTARHALEQTVARALLDRALRECALTVSTAGDELDIGLGQAADGVRREDAA
jgi:signal transduction histidine kinase